MSLATEFLSAYLEQSETTQAEYSKAAGIDPSLFTKLIQGEVALNVKNVPKLLRGLDSESAKIEFLSKYLEEQIPPEFAGSVTVMLNKLTAPSGTAMEDSEKDSMEIQLVLAFAALPSDLYRRRLIKFLAHLKVDAGLRDLFTRTVAYLDDSDSK